MELTRISRKYAHVSLTATDADGAGVTLGGVSVALLQPSMTPTEETTWTNVSLVDGAYRVLLAGPDAEPDGAIVVATSSDLWARTVDAPEVDAARIGRIHVA